MPPYHKLYNEELEFTAETPEEFKDNKLPTLDFFLWLADPLQLREDYENSAGYHGSAMSGNQRYSILSNEMIRRLSNTNHEDPDQEDVLNIIETFIQQLKSSGYGRKCAREIVVCGRSLED